jgi:hypothetical protein
MFSGATRGTNDDDAGAHDLGRPVRHFLLERHLGVQPFDVGLDGPVAMSQSHATRLRERPGC